MIKVSNLEKYFGDTHVLKNINLKVEQGEKVVILGPSGSGKSTLIRCVNFLEKPTSGKIFIDNIELTAPNAPINKVRQSVSMVFQNFNLYPHKTVIENLTLAPIKVQKVNKEESIKSGMFYFKKVGLEDKADAYPNQLSGGQKQRVAIVRALNMYPKIMLFDEPTSALDPEMMQEVLDVITKLANENITIVIVTHEMSFARQIADRIIFMDNGKIIEEGASGIFFENPQHSRTKQFLSKIVR